VKRALWLLSLALTACPSPPVTELNPPRTPSAAIGDVRHETGSFVGAKETALFEQSWHPAGRARAVLVIHHGLKSRSDHYSEFALRLAKGGLATYAYDMRGHGRSAGRRASLDDFADLVADLAQFLKRVRAREPGRPIFVMGHSVGGAVVTLHQIERRPAIAGLIVLAPAIRVRRMPLEAAFTPLTGALFPNLPVVDVPDEHFTRSPEIREEMAKDPLIYHPPGPARTAVALLGALRIIWARMDEIDVPIAGLHGTADRATDPRGTRELIRRVRSSDRTLLLYRGLYHDLVREPEREQVMDDIERWLERRSPAR
jgi:alpha-beta hydrolase superfamily lysophospholipase